MLAVLVLQRSGCPSIMHLRNLNPYVEAAITDWKASCNVAASIPKVLSVVAPLPSHLVFLWRKKHNLNELNWSNIYI